MSKKCAKVPQNTSLADGKLFFSGEEAQSPPQTPPYWKGDTSREGDTQVGRRHPSPDSTASALHFRPNFKFSRSKVFFVGGGGGIPILVCTNKASSISRAYTNLRRQHPLRAEM